MSYSRTFKKPTSEVKILLHLFALLFSVLRFKAHELEDAKLREEMKNLNLKRKKLMHLANTEKEKFEKAKKVPEVNK